MKLNSKEDKILNFINKYKDDYEEAFNEDSSWEIFYNLSNIRKNIVRWYPFKEKANILEIYGEMGAITEELCNRFESVTTLEPDPNKAKVILERNSRIKNLEVIVNNINDVTLTKKYDYILISSILEKSTFEECINNLKKNLKDKGKILIATDNKFGLKYWCNTNDISNINTFSKIELEELTEKCNMYGNYYYIFPDYKLPQIIYTDKAIEKKIFTYYTPYYINKAILLEPERSIFKKIYKDDVLPFFANSFLLELSLEECETEVDYVKFNNYRNKKFCLFTYLKDGKFYKKNVYEEGKEFLNSYANSTKELEEFGYKVIPVNKDENGYYLNEVKNYSFEDYIIKEYNKNGEESLYKNFKILEEYVKRMCTNESIDIEKNVFKEYDVEISESKLLKLHFLKTGFIDIVPQNMLILDNDYYLIDQEWKMNNVPYEYIIYRGIMTFVSNFDDKEEKLEYLMKKLDIYDYLEEFELLEKSFRKSITSESHNTFKIYTKYELLKK